MEVPGRFKLVGAITSGVSALADSKRLLRFEALLCIILGDSKVCVLCSLLTLDYEGRENNLNQICAI